jgi:hypothetical protein
MKENKILKWALILSIVIVANLFFNYALSLVLNSPEYKTYCPFEKTSQVIENKQQCEEANGIWNPGQQVYEKTVTPIGYCDLTSKCDNAFQEAQKAYEQKVFIALVVIGVLILVASFFIKSSTVLVSAFALTAVVDFIVASIRYWQYSDKILKVSILFIALVTLIYLAIKKFRDLTE